jgi:hypothetical protein
VVVTMIAATEPIGSVTVNSWEQADCHGRHFSETARVGVASVNHRNTTEARSGRFGERPKHSEARWRDSRH